MNQAQLEREQSSIDAGAARYQKTFDKARTTGQLATTGPAIELQRRLLEPAAEAIARYADECRRSNRSLAKARYLDALASPDGSHHRVAYLVVRHLLNNLGEPLNSIAVQLGAAFEQELNLTLALETEEAGPLLRFLLNDRYRGSSPHFRAQAADRARRRAFGLPARSDERPGDVLAVDDETGEEELVGVRFNLKTDERGQIGQSLIHVVCNSEFMLSMTYRPETEDEPAGLFTIATEKQWSNRRHRYERIQRIRPTPALLRYIDDRNVMLETLRPIHEPMVAPPLPWGDGPHSGGYYSIRLPAIKRASDAFMADLHANGCLTPLYETLNALQSTAYTINTLVVDTARALWEAGTRLPCWPERVERPLPPMPPGCAQDVEAYKLSHPKEFSAWRKACENVWRHNNSATRMTECAEVGQRLAWLEQQVESGNQPKWFVWQADFRLRLYPVSTVVHPQGDDLARASLLFSEGKPMTPAGVVALRRSLATAWALNKLDKAEYSVREQWVLDNEQRIYQAGTDPLADLWWVKANDGSPFQFLALAGEYAGWMHAQARGEEFITHVPIFRDATTNGIQHLAAIARNVEDGQRTCLVDTAGLVGDIYGDVALKVNAMLSAHENPLAAHFVGRISRAVCKAPAMTLSYGATISTFQAQFREHKALYEGLDRAQRREAISLLATTTMAAIRSVVRSASMVMGVLQSLARAACENGLPIVWTLPDGCEVRQDYRKHKLTRIRTVLNGALAMRRDRVSLVQSDLARLAGLTKGACELLEIANAQDVRDFLTESRLLVLHRSEVEALLESWTDGDVTGFLLARFAARGVQPRADLADGVAAAVRWVVNQAIASHHVRQEEVEECDEDTGAPKRVVREITIAEPTAQSDTQAHVRSVAANFIHSADACALRMTVRACVAEGITSLAMIHDSYGCHAPDMPRMEVILREQFVALHRENLAQRFASGLVERGYISREQADACLAQLQLGELDIEGVLTSPYFFS